MEGALNGQMDLIVASRSGSWVGSHEGGGPVRRYAGVVVLCGLLVIPALLFARAPAPRPRSDPAAEASAAVAEQLLVKQYGANAKGVKGAKVKFSFLVTEPYTGSENGKSQSLFAVAAEAVSFSGDGLVTLKGARFVQHHYCPQVIDGEKFTGWTKSSTDLVLLRFRFARPVRRLQDIHKSQLKEFEIGNAHALYDNAHVELIVKRITD
jgi:hypothetical protein